MKIKNTAFVFLGLVCAFGYYSCSDDVNFFTATPLSEPVENLKVIKDGFAFTEGPAVDKDGNVFFTDQPNDKIWKWDASTGDVSVWLEGTGRANGMEFDKDGNLIACADMYGELWKIKPDKSHTVLVNNYNGKLLNGPNDVWINPVTGGIYITDPMFPRDYWQATDPRKINNPAWPPTKSEQATTGKGGHVYYLAPGATSLVRVTTMSGWASDSWPNGVAGTPDGKKLYVNKWAGDNLGGTWSFDIGTDGSLSNLKKVTDIGGDGMSLDEQGHLYISNGLGVKVIDPTQPSSSALIMTIPVSTTGAGATNNVFAGKDQKTLIITGPVDKLTSLQMNVKGVEKF